MLGEFADFMQRMGKLERFVKEESNHFVESNAKYMLEQIASSMDSDLKAIRRREE